MNKEELINLLNSKLNTVERGNLFNEFVIKSQFPLDFEKFINTDGSNDGGIDSYWILESEDDGDDCFFIVQAKYGASFRGCDTIRSEITKLHEGLSDIDFLGNRGSHLNIRNSINTRNNPKVLNYFLGVSEDLNESEYKCLDTNIQNLYSLGFDEINYHIVTIDKIIESFDYSTSKIPVKLEGYAFTPNREQLTGYMNLGEIRKISKYTSKLKDPSIIFAKNVRLDLGGRTKVNKDIQNTVENDSYRLSKLNLGITIVTRDKLVDIGGNTFNLTGMSISNGAQSFSSIVRGLNQVERLKGENNLPLDALIHVEIIQATSREEEKIITVARNTNNNVKKASLCAAEGESLYKNLRDVVVSKFGKDFNFNLKAVSDPNREMSGSHDVISTLGSVIGLFGDAVTPTKLMPNENNQEDFNYKLITKLINNPMMAGLVVYISNKCVASLQSSIGISKRTTRSIAGGWPRVFVLMQVLFKLVSEYSSDKKLINKIANEYIDNLETPGLSVNVPDKFSEICISLLKDTEVKDFLIGVSGGIWNEYALDPQTKKGYLNADYYDRFPEKRDGKIPNDRDIRGGFTSKNCPRLSILSSKTVSELIEKGNYKDKLDKIKHIIKTTK